jgi:hypothetical protein
MMPVHCSLVSALFFALLLSLVTANDNLSTVSETTTQSFLTAPFIFTAGSVAISGLLLSATTIAYDYYIGHWLHPLRLARLCRFFKIYSLAGYLFGEAAGQIFHAQGKSVEEAVMYTEVARLYSLAKKPAKEAQAYELAGCASETAALEFQERKEYKSEANAAIAAAQSYEKAANSYFSLNMEKEEAEAYSHTGRAYEIAALAFQRATKYLAEAQVYSKAAWSYSMAGNLDKQAEDLELAGFALTSAAWTCRLKSKHAKEAPEYLAAGRSYVLGALVYASMGRLLEMAEAYERGGRACESAAQAFHDLDEHRKVARAYLDAARLYWVAASSYAAKNMPDEKAILYEHVGSAREAAASAFRRQGKHVQEAKAYELAAWSYVAANNHVKKAQAYKKARRALQIVLVASRNQADYDRERARRSGRLTEKSDVAAVHANPIVTGSGPHSSHTIDKVHAAQ